MKRSLSLFAVLCVLCGHACSAEKPARPNILFILADDLGYGDLGCFNPQSKIPTPNLDRLAAQGLRFTDAHAPGAVCVPSRYGLLTGRYPFRRNGNPSQGPLIEPGRTTIASLLKEKGYATAMVGKWHLGFDGGIDFDCSRPLRGGPVDHGFDSFFGQHASLDIPPYFYIENDRCVAAPTETVAASSSPDWSPIQGAFWREGKIGPGYKHEEVLARYTQKAVAFLESHSRKSPGQPFFLYLAFTAPHTPWLPLKPFQGKSQAGMYGDFVMQVDDAVGQVLLALDRSGGSDHTLVFFSSDNGPVWNPADVEKFGHRAAHIYRGMKGDAWEGGHRMPFLARWPGQVKPGSVSGETICFTDMLATFAALVGAGLPDGAGEDSFNFLPALLGQKPGRPIREATILESSRGVLVLRQGDWKLIPRLGSGGFSQPAQVKAGAGEPEGQLYNLAADPSEQKNLHLEKPEVVQRLTALLEKIKKEGRSRP